MVTVRWKDTSACLICRCQLLYHASTIGVSDLGILQPENRRINLSLYYWVLVTSAPQQIILFVEVIALMDKKSSLMKLDKFNSTHTNTNVIDDGLVHDD